MAARSSATAGPYEPERLRMDVPALRVWWLVEGESTPTLVGPTGVSCPNPTSTGIPSTGTHCARSLILHDDDAIGRVSGPIRDSVGHWPR